MAGHIFLPILVGVFTFLSKRHPTLINLCRVWIFIGICSCLLLYTNTQTGPEPSYGLCLTQASLLYGSMPMSTVVCLALVYHVWTTVYVSKIDPEVAAPWHRLRLIMLLVIPWIIFAIWATGAAWIGYHDPFRISRHRRFFYCSLDYGPFSTAMSIFCTLTLLVTLGFGVSIGRTVWRNWRAVRKGLSTGEIDMSLAIRVTCFMFYVCIGLIMSLISIKAPKSPIPDLYFASVGFVIVLIFGTQKNILISLGLWLKTIFESTRVWLKTARRTAPLWKNDVIKSLKFWRNRGIKGARGLPGWRRRQKVVDLIA